MGAKGTFAGIKVGQNDPYKEEEKFEEVGEFVSMVLDHCKTWECYIELGLTFLFYYWHFYLMIAFLGKWAEGSTILIFASMLFTFISIWNMAIVMKWPGFLQMESWKRSVPFAFAGVYDLYYFMSVVAWIIMALTDKGEKGETSFEEIICAWIIWITTPTAFVTIAYTVNELYYTDDIKFRDDDDGSGDDRRGNRYGVAY